MAEKGGSGRGARCREPFCVVRQVTSVIAGSRAPEFRIRSGKTKGGAGRLTGVLSEDDLQLSYLPGNRTGLGPFAIGTG